tara:strand:- start:204 stop:401 length:198 start_codon:yes stop_codon:yes gene_type:complete
MHEYIKMIDELVLIKASLQLIETDNKKLKEDLIDYIDNLLAEYNAIIEQFEADMEEEYGYKRRLH